MRKALTLIACIIIVATSCKKASTYDVSDHDVIAHVNNQTIRLQPISDKIIRVSAVPGSTIPTTQSLSVLTPEPFRDFDVQEEGDQLVVATRSLKAYLSLTTGEVRFTDSTGTELLREKSGGGKDFRAIQTGDENTYEISQIFESPADEAFYGLGQHQEGLMNYKGKDVSLFQYNTKIAVPFLVSTKHYGLLWDNYSLTKFGDRRPYKQLAALKLFDQEGKPGGLSATFSNKNKPEQIYLTRTDTVINYQFLPDQKKFPKEVPLSDSKVVWEGSFGTPENGRQKFLLYYAGYIKVWVNGELKADHWRQAWNPGTVKFELDAEQGKQYPIRIEWLPDGGESYLSLTWQHNNEEDQQRLTLSSEAGDQIDYFIVAGSTMDELVSGYRQLTGKAELAPRWALGFWQSRERYKTQQEILETAEEFRKRKISLDNIVLDWSYWPEEQWGSQDFDLTRFPDAAGMIKKLHDEYHLHFMISVWPKFYEGIEAYNAFDKNGWLYKANINNRQRDWIGKGYVSTFYDAFNSDARSAFWKLMNDKLYVKGIDAWWLDSTEPDILSNASIDARKELMNPTALGSSVKYFNAYPLMNEKGVYEGQRSVEPNKRVFIFTRSAYAGSQRYAAASWSGDIAANWQDFKTQIPAGLNFELSGIPYWTTDIGGFSVERKNEHATGEDLENWRELNTRWYQFGTFNPLHRVHGQYPYREVYNIAPDTHVAYKTILHYNKLRYRLMPYIYSMAASVYTDNYTPMRALAMDFPEDRAVEGIGTQFMFGPSLLVAPVTQYKARTWKVYLPQNAGGWFNFHTGKHVGGGESVHVDAPLEQMPLFVRAGSILPAGPVMLHTAEKKSDPITLYVFTGRDADFTLYNDDGLTYNYQKGEYERIPLHYDEATGKLTIGAREGSYAGMLADHTFEIKWITSAKGSGVDLTTTPDEVVNYSGNPVEIVQKP